MRRLTITFAASLALAGCADAGMLAAHAGLGLVQLAARAAKGPKAEKLPIPPKPPVRPPPAKT